VATDDRLVRCEVTGGVARVTLDRPKYRNAQSRVLLEQLDEVFEQAAEDPEVGVIVLFGAGDHFSAGHDIGSPERDIHKSFPRVATVAWEHEDKAGAENLFIREAELYLGMCRRWRELPKPTVAMVQGACVAGGLMLAWVCDLIVAAQDAFFADPVVRMGIPGVEYFAHPWELGPRKAKELLLTGDALESYAARLRF